MVLGFLDMGGDRLGQRDAATLHDDVDVIGRPSEETVPDETADHECPNAHLPGDFADQGENGMIQKTARNRCHIKKIRRMDNPPVQR